MQQQLRAVGFEKAVNRSPGGVNKQDVIMLLPNDSMYAKQGAKATNLNDVPIFATFVRGRPTASDLSCRPLCTRLACLFQDLIDLFHWRIP
jgi:hypothetical protein